MDAKKTDVLNKIFLNTFENIKKNLNKKDPYYNKVKTAFGNIKENHPDSQTNEGIKYNLILMISTLETRIIKIIEKVLSTLDQIISLDVIDYKILQEKVPSILENLFAKSNIGDDNINYKILNLCLIMYSNKNIKINGMNLINLIKICLNVFLLTKNSNCQNASKSTLIQVIDLIIEKVENAVYASSLSNNRFSYTGNTINNYLGNFSNKLSKVEKDQIVKKSSSIPTYIDKKDSQNEFRTTVLNKNDFAVSIQHKNLAEKYMNFYLDILEINNLINNKNNSQEKQEEGENADHIQSIDNSFLLDLIDNIQKPNEGIVFMNNENDEKISSSSNSNTHNSNKLNKISPNTENRNNLKILFEKLNLENYKILNETEKQIGKFGWCINCRKQSSFFSDIIHFPICSNECEKEIIKLTKSVKIDLNVETSNEITNSSLTELDNYREDYINTVKILSKLSIKETKQQTNIEEINLRLRELCLELIQLLLVKGSKYFNQEIKLLQVIKESTIDSLVKNSMSNEMNIFKLSVNLFLTIISYYREYLKNEIEIFINKVLIAILESENLGFVYKEIILDALLKIADNGNFLVEIYSNYDCDINHKNIFYEIINLMTKIINGLYKKPKYYNTFKNNQEATLRIKCLEFLSNFIKSLSLLVDENNEISGTNNINNNNLNTNQNTFKNSSIPNQKGNPSNSLLNVNKDGNQTLTAEANFINQSEFYSQSHYQNFDEDLNISTIDNDIKDKINYNLKLKSIISKAVEKFNYNPSNCFNYLKAHNLLPTDQMFSEIKKKLLKEFEQNDQEKLSDFLNANNQNMERENHLNATNYSSLFFNPNSNMNYLNNLEKDQLIELSFEDFYAREIAIFLKLNLKEINKQSLGAFLGGAKPLNQKILEFFIDSYNFKNFHILEAMRILFSDFNLVGEGQIVDRIVKFFGQKYHKDNPTTFKIPDVAYYLSFSIMLLQTDLHRPEVDKKMSPQVFINNFNLVCKDGVEDSILIDVYNRVLNDPIRFPGQKLYSNKNKKDLIKLEKESILKSTYEELHIKNYGTNINSMNQNSQGTYK